MNSAPWPGMAHADIVGEILYTSAKEGLEGTPRGHERFHFTRHTDGAVTLRAHCRIEEPAPSVLRDIVYSLDAQRRPLDCLVRLTVADRFLGAGLVEFDHAAGQVHLASHGPALGRLRQTRAIPPGLDGFGTHPIAGDAYLTHCLDISGGPARRTIHVLLPSPDHRGAGVPMLAEVRIDLAYLGDEEVDVAAGRFACHRFAFLDESESGMGGKEHPRYDLWVTADDRRLFVKGGVGGYMGTRYELQRLTTRG